MGKCYGRGPSFIGDCDECGCEHWGHVGEPHEEAPLCPGCTRWAERELAKKEAAAEKFEKAAAKASLKAAKAAAKALLKAAKAAAKAQIKSEKAFKVAAKAAAKVGGKRGRGET